MKDTWAKSHRGLLVLLAAAVIVPVLWVVTATPREPVYSRAHLVATAATLPGGYCGVLDVLGKRAEAAPLTLTDEKLTTKEVAGKFMRLASLGLELQAIDGDKADSIYWGLVAKDEMVLSNDREGIAAVQESVRNNTKLTPAGERFDHLELAAVVQFISGNLSLQCEGSDLYGADSSTAAHKVSAAAIRYSLITLFSRAVLLDASARGGLGVTNPVTPAALDQILTNASPSGLFRVVDNIGTWAGAPDTVKLTVDGASACYTFPANTSASFLVSAQQAAPSSWIGMETPCPTSALAVRQIYVLRTLAPLQPGMERAVLRGKSGFDKSGKELKNLSTSQFSVVSVTPARITSYNVNFPAPATFSTKHVVAPWVGDGGWLVRTSSGSSAPPVCVLVPSFADPQIVSC